MSKSRLTGERLADVVITTRPVARSRSASSSPTVNAPVDADRKLPISNTFGSTLRIQIQAAGGDTDPSKRWCSPITSSSGVIPWSTFNTACWDGSGTNFDGTTPLQSAMVVVPGDLTPVPFNFCLNSMGPS